MLFFFAFIPCFNVSTELLSISKAAVSHYSCITEAVRLVVSCFIAISCWVSHAVSLFCFLSITVISISLPPFEDGIPARTGVS